MAPETVYRHPHGRGFTYRTAQGRTFSHRKWRQWIKDLAIPPAWTEVEITLDEDARVLASGRDDAGRKQYIYSDSWREAQDRRKFDRITRFAETLETMRRVTGQHLILEGMPRDKVMACMVRLIDAAYFRPGSERYSQENDSYGLTTMRSRHLTIEGDELIFDYQGKSGQQQHRVVEDERLAEVVAQLDEIPGYEIFKYYDDDGRKVRVDSQDLNDYIHDIMGEDFSAKDFRTWAGTSLAALALDELGPGENERASQKNVVEVVKRVAQRLGNTPSIARASYIDPRVVESYLDGRTLSHFRALVTQELKTNTLIGPDEQAVLVLLKSRLEQ
ncbi:DNA topoisomerase IB [Larsenimonas rhizosphaerae]|uniref:DNA topoisomerase n=1 Tax=Larsenimonas rhizosphaerae TaxID=2944682 RepID=A0AA41ZG73_9GAMM|nr:DNA topoisomerase IB [Larsenimonas rhizosphaerae]MCM2129386.1 DNA topoisomerase IB [Larsenimonas rhizosphaerae]MCX2524041.1 DNA topoisomerase IB [Larsenimonas rhizosphaerae]